MEAVIGALVNIRVIGDLVSFEGFLEGGPAGVDASIETGVMQRERRFDLGGIRGRGLCAVEGRGCGEVGAKANGEHVDDASAEAETDGADLAVAIGTALQ